ncbi:hypothetical protein D9756_002982 [Leucocoprinus leucothites]|uniref:Uncharacterized protein n=1 Tax=Leucocoprinus leucothites TaxID=201217 RepID=A0A8H5LIV6_9AGAR|nr:hypothetical protein D9756_002982 [Leucoagaricus leucothites]
MATVFQRPMPAPPDTQTTTIPTRRRRRDSVEVIDVDELDDDIYQTHRAPEPGPSRPAQRRRLSVPSEIISLLDESDDDDIVITGARVRPASRTRLQSPPPRNLSFYVPPVPPVPHRYAGQTSLPMRRHAPSAAASPPVVRPNDQPFPFEANMHHQQPHSGLQLPPVRSEINQLPQLHNPRINNPDNLLPPRPLQPAPPSHHVPALGLGGALIAQNRARNQHQNQHRAHHPPYEPGGHSLLNRVGSGVRRIFGGPGLAPDGENPRNGVNFLALGNNFGFLDDPLQDADVDPDHMLALQLLAEDGGEGGFVGWDPAFNPAGAFIRSEMLRRRNNARGEESVPYRKEYTHPRPPEPGFTFDFAPKSPVEVIDVTSPVMTTKSAPIVIDDDEPVLDGADAGPSSTKLHPETPSKTNTHTLVCANCLGPLVLGSNLTPEDQKHRRIWGLRCGHLIDGKCFQEIGTPKNALVSQPTDAVVIADRKGKGKAKAVEEDDGSGEYQEPTKDEHEPEENMNSIRSRLRPRNTATPSTSTSHSFSSSSSSSSAQTTIKRSTKSKATQEQQLPPPEFLWSCPVIGCGLIHASIKVNGEWVSDRGESTHTSSSSSSGSRGGGRGRTRGGGGVGPGRPGWLEFLNADAGEGGGKAVRHARGAIPLFL